jgi:hypothetical protein
MSVTYVPHASHAARGISIAFAIPVLTPWIYINDITTANLELATSPHKFSTSKHDSEERSGIFDSR